MYSVFLVCSLDSAFQLSLRVSIFVLLALYFGLFTDNVNCDPRERKLARQVIKSKKNAHIIELCNLA